MGLNTGKIILLVLVGSILSIEITMDDSLAQTAQNPFLGDFKCYLISELNFFRDDEIIKDQFDEGNGQEFDLFNIPKICTAVNKEESKELDPNNQDEPLYDQSPTPQVDNQHFIVYNLCAESSDAGNCNPTDSVDLTVELTDQFGSTIHTIAEPIEFWVPASKNHFECPPGYTFDFIAGECVAPDPGTPCPGPPFTGYLPDPTDNNLCKGPPLVNEFPQLSEIHYKCYTIDSKPNPLGFLNVNLFDQFFEMGNIRQINEVDKFCNPAQKLVGFNEFEGTLDNEHLKCYQFFDEPDILNNIFTVFTDQFNSEPFSLFEENEICLVADKKCPLGSPGRLPDCSIPLVGGSLIPIDTTMVLLAGTHSVAAWMIPVIVAGMGFAIVIARKF